MRAVIDSSEKRLSEQRKCNEDGTGEAGFALVAATRNLQNSIGILFGGLLLEGCRMELGVRGMAVLIQVLYASFLHESLRFPLIL